MSGGGRGPGREGPGNAGGSAHRASEACALCGTETVCRMEVAGRMRPMCPECTGVVAAGDEAGALARALLAGPDAGGVQ